MLVDLKLASSKDKKPTLRINDLSESYPLLTSLKITDVVEVVFCFVEKSYSKLSYTFHPSREFSTLYGHRPWTFQDKLPEVGNPRKIQIIELKINGKIIHTKKVEAKPRPPAFPTDFLGNGLLEDKHEKVNPLDERMERLLVEIQSSLILAGGCHKAKHYDHSFKEVMRNLLSNVDKKTLVRIIENSYVF